MEKSNIVLLHGALGTKRQFGKLEKLLSNQFNVYTLNFEGHGNNESTSAFSIALFTENTVNFFQENNIQKTNIFGYSMGGYVGLNVAKQYPEYIDKMVTFGTKFNWSQETAEKEIKMLNPLIIEQKVPKYAEMLRNLHHPNDWKEVLRKTADMMLDLSTGRKLSDNDLKLISHKILIGVGSLDKMVSIEESQKAASHLANAQLKIIEGFSHPLEKNDANLMAKIIEEFVNQTG